MPVPATIAKTEVWYTGPNVGNRYMQMTFAPIGGGMPVVGVFDQPVDDPYIDTVNECISAANVTVDL